MIFNQKPVGKLTAPVMRFNGNINFNQPTTMDQFKIQIKNLDKDEEMKNDIFTNNNNNMI